MNKGIQITEEVSITFPNSKPKPIKVSKTPRRKRKSERRLLERKLDALCRDIVLDRDVRCVCPPPKNSHSEVLQAGHLITRAKKSVRWSLLNIHTQCSSCNLLHEHVPHRYTNWFLDKFGIQHYERLCQDAEQADKMQLYELQELYEQMKKIRQLQLERALTGNPWKPYFTQADILSGAWKK